MHALPLALWLDLLGTFVFGLSGAMLAVRRGLDIFGIAVLAGSAALFGGALRDVMLGATPPAALMDPRYPMAALAAAICVFFGHGLIDRLNKPVMLLDAVGLGLFAVTGCSKALQFGLGAGAAVLLGILTAVGGGVIRDLLVAEVPRVLREEIYAFAAMLGALVVVLGHKWGFSPGWTETFGAALAAVFRIVSVWRGWHAPRAFRS